MDAWPVTHVRTLRALSHTLSVRARAHQTTHITCTNGPVLHARTRACAQIHMFHVIWEICERGILYECDANAPISCRVARRRRRRRHRHQEKLTRKHTCAFKSSRIVHVAAAAAAIAPGWPTRARMPKHTCIVCCSEQQRTRTHIEQVRAS